MAKPRDIVTALEEMGIPVVREDTDEVHALCPKHEEFTGEKQRKPHWSVNRETGYHHCFSCGYSGTFLGLVMDFVHHNDPFSAQRWIIRHGIRLTSPEDLVSYAEQVPVKHVPDQARVEMGEARLALFYRPPLAQLEKRALSQESVEFYDVLWDIEKQGWVIPIREPDGKLIGWQFKSERVFLNYPPSVAKGHCLFGLEHLEEGETAILVESPLDCLRIHTAGINGAVASMGAGVTDAQMRALLQRTDRLILALDNDKAGATQAQRLLMGEEDFRGKVTSRGWVSRFSEVRVFNYGDSEAKDPGDMSDDEILEGLDTAQHPVALGWGRIKKEKKDDRPHRTLGAARSRKPRGSGADPLRPGLRRAPRRTG